MKLLIKKNTLILLCCLFVVMAQNVVYLDEFAFVGIAMSLLRLLVFAIVCILFWRKHERFTKFEYSWIVFYVWWLIVTVMGVETKIIPVISKAIDAYLFVMLLRLYGQQDTKTFLWGVTRILSFFIYINFILIVVKNGAGLWKDGFYYLLVGNYNGFGPIFIITYAVEVLYMYQKHKIDWNVIFLLVAMIGSLLYVGSMTSLVGLSLLVVYSLVVFLPLRRTLLWCFFIFYVIFQIFVVFLLGDLSNYPYATFFIEEVLGKDLTFTDRMRVWELVAEYISEKPWIGHGFHSNDWYEDNFNVMTTHNKIYSLLLDGGIVLLSIFVMCLVVSFRSANRWKNGKEVCVLQFAVCALFFMMVMEAYPTFYVFILLTLMYYIKYFLSHDKL